MITWADKTARQSQAGEWYRGRGVRYRAMHTSCHDIVNPILCVAIFMGSPSCIPVEDCVGNKNTVNGAGDNDDNTTDEKKD